MAKPLRSLIRKTLFARKGNLVSLDDPFHTMAGLLQGHRVTAVVDAGASDGRVSKRLSEKFPDATFHLFEPHPDYAHVLDDLCGRDPRFKAYKVALSDKAGQLDLYMTGERGPSSLYRPTDRAGRTWGDKARVHNTAPVQVVALDEWPGRAALGTIHLLKFDIQGAEPAAMRGARATLQNEALLVYTEVMFNRMYEGGAVFSEIDQVLRECGFILYNLYGPRTDGNGALVHANAIYAHAERLRL